jgi:hypothetical protein
MIASLESFRFASEAELRAPQRLKKVFWQTQGGNLFAVIAVSLALGLPLLGFMLYIPFYVISNPRGSSILILEPFLGLFLFFVWLFVKGFVQEIDLNPIRDYLKNQSGFAFVKGEINRWEFSHEEIRASDRFIGYGKILEPGMEHFPVIELFSPSAFRSIASKKNSRPGLPLGIVVLIDKKNPHRSCMVGL